MASTYLSRTTNSGSTGTKWTFSAWVKRANTGGNNCIWNQSNDANNTTYNEVAIKSANELDVQIRNGTSGNNGTYIRRRTSRLFRDCNAFYHIVVRYDSTDGTAGNRLRLYVNGVEETSMQESVGTVPQNQVTVMATSGADQTFGRGVGSSNHYWDGVISHAHLCDGYSYAPSEFGETDATTGEWKIKTTPSVSYGTNGWWILKDGNSITDSSPNSNAFSLTAGTLTKTEDCPDNVFATMNSLDNFYPAMTLSNGNTRALTIAGKYTYIPTTLGMTSGKYYAEIKCTAQSGSQNEFMVGITSTSTLATTYELGHYVNDYGYNGVAGNYRTNNGNNSYGSSFTTGDIIGIAVDLDNNKLYFSKNGTFQNSGNPTSGSTGTGAISITDPTLTSRGAYFFALCYYSSSIVGTFDANFGNGYFGTTAVSSAGTNASNNGIFEYDVPSGYTALSTKGLNL